MDAQTGCPFRTDMGNRMVRSRLVECLRPELAIASVRCDTREDLLLARYGSACAETSKLCRVAQRGAGG